MDWIISADSHSFDTSRVGFVCLFVTPLVGSWSCGAISIRSGDLCDKWFTICLDSSRFKHYLICWSCWLSNISTNDKTSVICEINGFKNCTSCLTGILEAHLPDDFTISTIDLPNSLIGVNCIILLNTNSDKIFAIWRFSNPFHSGHFTFSTNFSDPLIFATIIVVSFRFHPQIGRGFVFWVYWSLLAFWRIISFKDKSSTSFSSSFTLMSFFHICSAVFPRVTDSNHGSIHCFQTMNGMWISTSLCICILDCVTLYARSWTSSSIWFISHISGRGWVVKEKSYSGTVFQNLFVH